MSQNRLYYKDPYLSEFTSEVVKCTKEKGYFNIILKESYFYPEGGGQIYDLGTIGTANVIEVHEVNNEIVHYTDKPLAEGETVLCKIDFQRRFSNMQHHTAEHVASGIINKLFGGDNVGFHLGENLVTMDYNVVLDKKDILKIEELSNDAVFKNIPVEIEYHKKTPDFKYRSKIEIEGTIRIVKIEDCDTCACCGTHTKFTGEIGLIKIVDFHKYKSGTRLYLAAGKKALADYQEKQSAVAEISAMLSAKQNEAATHVKNIIEERNGLRQAVNLLQTKMMAIEADKIIPEEKIMLFFDTYTVDDLIKFYGFIKDKASVIALFSGNDADGYKYFLKSEKHETKALAQNTNQALKGKGGGKDYICGSVSSIRNEIEQYINNL